VGPHGCCGDADVTFLLARTASTTWNARSLSAPDASTSPPLSRQLAGGQTPPPSS
jgi:hypothetical protein